MEHLGETVDDSPLAGMQAACGPLFGARHGGRCIQFWYNTLEMGLLQEKVRYG